MIMEKKGKLYIISSVAGGGKSTLIGLLLKKHPDLLFSISYTSRYIRVGEQNGVHYHFITREKFEQLIAENFFYEWALVHDNYYGTPKYFIEENLAKNKKIILDIDVQGASVVKASLPEAISIFILPPSIDVWQKRLKNRGTDPEEVIQKRIRNGLKELELQNTFDHKIINHTIEEALAELEKIILS
jgi:guanylate kinase